MVPAPEELAAQGSPVSGLDIEVRPWQESADPVAVVTGVVGSASTVALHERMWAEKVLSFRAAMPHARQVLAGPVLRRLRMAQSAAEVQALRSAGEAIDRVHAQMAQWLRAHRTERAVG